MPGHRTSKVAAAVIARLLHSPPTLTGLPLGQTRCRVHDDHDGRFDAAVGVTLLSENEISVAIVGAEACYRPLRYRLPMIGGGMIRRVRNALLLVAEAIRKVVHGDLLVPECDPATLQDMERAIEGSYRLDTLAAGTLYSHVLRSDGGVPMSSIGVGVAPDSDVWFQMWNRHDDYKTCTPRVHRWGPSFSEDRRIGNALLLLAEAIRRDHVECPLPHQPFRDTLELDGVES